MPLYSDFFLIRALHDLSAHRMRSLVFTEVRNFIPTVRLLVSLNGIDLQLFHKTFRCTIFDQYFTFLGPWALEAGSRYLFASSNTVSGYGIQSSGLTKRVERQKEITVEN